MFDSLTRRMTWKAIAQFVQMLRLRWKFRKVAYSSFRRRVFLWPCQAKPLQVQRIVVPTFEIATNPTIKLSDIKARRFNIVDRMPPRGCVVVTDEEWASQMTEDELLAELGFALGV